MIDESHIPLGNLNKNNVVDLRKAEGTKKLTAQVHEVKKKIKTKLKILNAGSTYKKMGNLWQI